jgi:hypothetical protein
MEIVVATIGLSLGILTPQMFSIIVMVAIVTSFLAPVGLRLTMPRVRMTRRRRGRHPRLRIRRRLRSRARARAARDGRRRQRGRGGAAGVRDRAQEQRLGEDRARRRETVVLGSSCSSARQFSGSATEQVEMMKALAGGGERPRWCR